MMARKFSILIIDDDVNLASNLRDIIEVEGYSTTLAPNGQTALILCKEKVFDLVLIDIRLPDVPGVELVRKLTKLLPKMEYIIVTGYASLDTAIEAVERRGVVGYETKPLNIGHLVALIKQVDRRKRAEEALRESEELYRLTISSISDAVFITDDTGEFTFICTNVDIIFGYSFSEVQAFGNIAKLLGDDLFARNQLETLGEIQNVDREITDKAGRGHALLVNVKRVSIKGGTILYTCRDITERKQAEEALKESGARLTEAQAVGHIGNWSWDLRTDELLWSKENYRIFGLSHEVSPSYENFVKTVHPEDREFVNKRVQDALKRKKPYDIDYRIILPNGKERIIQSVGKVDYDNEDLPIRFFGTVQDITERKQAEEALIESEKRFRTSVENMLDCFGIYSAIRDESGRIVDFLVEYVNEAACASNLMTKEEQIGKRLCELLPSHRETGLFDEYCQVAETGKPLVKESLIYEDTYRKRHLARAFDIRVVKLGDGFTAAWRDITKRRQAEEALIESEKRYHTLFNKGNDAIFVHHPTADGMPGKFVEVNDIACQMLGYTRAELLQLKPTDITVPERKKVATREIMKRLLAEKRILAESVFRSKDGREFPVELSPHLFKLRGKGTILTIARDITERRKAEAERQKIDKLESIGILAGGIAHDFNNLLTGIMGNISLANSYVEARGKAADILLQAGKACSQAKDLTHQLLAFARGGAPIKKIVSIAELIEDSASFAMSGSNVRCEISLPDDLRAAEVDKGQISQAIINLIINADEAMPEGGIVNIRAKNTELKTESALPLPKGKYVEIAIEDHGIGIAKEHLQKIFDPYFTTKQKGSGLGLTTTYSIIKNHDGHITVTSEAGVGTTFLIYLPASKKSILTKKEAAIETIVVGQGRILVMDDEKLIREVTQRILTNEGYDVEIVSDGSAAIKRYVRAKESRQPFDAVILDLTVPGGIGGEEAIKELLKIDPGVKAIVSSGYSDDLILSTYRNYGFSEALEKPYGAKELTKAVYKVLQKESK